MARILAVDDSPSMRQMVWFALQRGGHEVFQAEDGVAALGLARQQPVDLVLSDVHMPRMDGIALVEALRRLPELRYVPMLMLTTESSAEAKQRAKAAGATGWITKPFQQEQLVAVVKRVLG